MSDAEFEALLTSEAKHYGVPASIETEAKRARAAEDELRAAHDGCDRIIDVVRAERDALRARVEREREQRRVRVRIIHKENERLRKVCANWADYLDLHMGRKVGDGLRDEVRAALAPAPKE